MTEKMSRQRVIVVVDSVSSPGEQNNNGRKKRDNFVIIHSFLRSSLILSVMNAFFSVA